MLLGQQRLLQCPNAFISTMSQGIFFWSKVSRIAKGIIPVLIDFLHTFLISVNETSSICELLSLLSRALCGVCDLRRCHLRQRNARTFIQWGKMRGFTREGSSRSTLFGSFVAISFAEGETVPKVEVIKKAAFSSAWGRNGGRDRITFFVQPEGKISFWLPSKTSPRVPLWPPAAPLSRRGGRPVKWIWPYHYCTSGMLSTQAATYSSFWCFHFKIFFLKACVLFFLNTSGIFL